MYRQQHLPHTVRKEPQSRLDCLVQSSVHLFYIVEVFLNNPTRVSSVLVRRSFDTAEVGAPAGNGFGLIINPHVRAGGTIQTQNLKPKPDICQKVIV